MFISGSVRPLAEGTCGPVTPSQAEVACPAQLKACTQMLSIAHHEPEWAVAADHPWEEKKKLKNFKNFKKKFKAVTIIHL